MVSHHHIIIGNVCSLNLACLPRPASIFSPSPLTESDPLPSAPPATLRQPPRPVVIGKRPASSLVFTKSSANCFTSQFIYVLFLKRVEFFEVSVSFIAIQVLFNLSSALPFLCLRSLNLLLLCLVAGTYLYTWKWV